MPVPNTALSAISPIDGRYHTITQPLSDYFSEAALIKHRILIESQYLLHLSTTKVIRKVTAREAKLLTRLDNLSPKDIRSIKLIEAKTRHDVKTIEYFLQQQLAKTSLKDLTTYIHIGLTSEDVNNLSYRLMVQNAHQQVLFPSLIGILKSLSQLASKHASLSMLARTHGQPAIPTTLGKEFSVFACRLLTQLQFLHNYQLTGKLNGAVGGFQAHTILNSKTNWPKFSQSFIKLLGLTPNLHTTQINPPDDLIQLFHHYHLINSILLDLCQDIWRYISDDWLVQIGKNKFVGSSTMPQKINPIEFENAEGNLVLASGLFETFARKLPISRLQRDLSDSTILRNIGTAFSHCLIAYHHLNQGLNHIVPNKPQIKHDLLHNWNILAEALQTHLRTTDNSKAYENVASKFKSKTITQSDWQQLTQNLSPSIQNLTPETYTGLSTQLTQTAVKDINKFLKKL